MRKLTKYLISAVLGIAGIILFTAIAINKRLPEPTYGPEADELARKMLQSLNYEAWDDLKFIQWTYDEIHHYIWDKEHNIVYIQWKDTQVVLHLDTMAGVVKVKDKLIFDEEKKEILNEAWEMWCAESFWLNAPFKVFDEGTKRGIVKQKDGTDDLMVTYAEGGHTPGDSYVWKLDQNNRPVSWQMWVKIFPIGGLSTSWEDYIELPGGAVIASNHKGSFHNIEITNLEAGTSLKDLDIKERMFSLP